MSTIPYPIVLDINASNLFWGKIQGFVQEIASSVPVQLIAADAPTFGRTALWSSQDSSRPLASLLTQLVARRDQAITSRVVPAIVDQAAANELALEVGVPFTITIESLPYSTLNCVKVAQVQHIPSINNSTDTGNGGMRPLQLVF